jgi:hypothetical protein
MLLAIDPGTTKSGYCLMDGYKPVSFGKVENTKMILLLGELAYTDAVIEMIACYGLPVGAEVLETCVWIGRYMSVCSMYCQLTPARITRNEVKQHICHSPRANDATIKQALVDRFASGVANHGKGSKSHNGWFYGFKADIWAAYALGTVHQDRRGK